MAKSHGWNSSRLLLVATMLGMGVVGFSPDSGGAAPCERTGRIDGSTIETVRQTMENAGYRQVRKLKQGGDNFWHGLAVTDRKTINIALSPQGSVMEEGD